MPLTLGSVCAGVGGFDLGLEMTGGFRTAWQIERDPWRRNVLAARWPDADRSITDLITATDDDFARLPRTDAQCAGLPCQPISVAGDRRGTDDPRWLLPHWLRCLRVLRPGIVLYENPAGALAPIRDKRGRIIDGPPIGHVLGGLAALGYDAEWYVLGAGDVGAAHERDRVWICAWLADADSERKLQPRGRVADERGWACDRRPVASHVGDTAGARPPRRAGGARRAIREVGGRAESHGRSASLVHASGAGREELHPSRIAGDPRHVTGRPDSGEPRELADTDEDGTQQPLGVCGRRTASELVELAEAWAARSEPDVGRPLDALSAWLDGRAVAGKGEAQHEWEPPRIAPREPNTARRVAALGDAIVPHCAMVLGFRALERAS